MTDFLKVNNNTSPIVPRPQYGSYTYDNRITDNNIIIVKSSMKKKAGNYNIRDAKIKTR